MSWIDDRGEDVIVALFACVFIFALVAVLLFGGESSPVREFTLGDGTHCVQAKQFPRDIECDF